MLWLFSDSRALFSKEGVTFGELGLFIIIAYAAGQLIQGIGNWIEWLWWKTWGGYPSKRVLGGHLISADQHKRVVEALRKDGKVTADVTTCALPECLAIVREVYSVVAAAGKAGRVDIFNGNYGLSRGLAAFLLVLLVAAIVLVKGLYVIGAFGRAALPGGPEDAPLWQALCPGAFHPVSSHRQAGWTVNCSGDHPDYGIEPTVPDATRVGVPVGNLIRLATEAESRNASAL